MNTDAPQTGFFQGWMEDPTFKIRTVNQSTIGGRKDQILVVVLATLAFLKLILTVDLQRL